MGKSGNMDGDHATGCGLAYGLVIFGASLGSCPPPQLPREVEPKIWLGFQIWWVASLGSWGSAASRKS